MIELFPCPGDEKAVEAVPSSNYTVNVNRLYGSKNGFIFFSTKETFHKLFSKTDTTKQTRGI